MPDRSDAAQAEWTEPADVEAAAPQAPARPDIQTFVVANARILIAVGILIVGIVFVMLGWYGAAYTNIITEQIPYLISGGLLGLGLIIVAGFLVSSALVERRTEELRRDLMRAMRGAPVAGAIDEAAYARSSNGAKVYALADGHSFHLAGCPIVEGKETRQLAPREAFAAGLAPCKLCGPE